MKKCILFAVALVALFSGCDDNNDDRKEDVVLYLGRIGLPKYGGAFIGMTAVAEFSTIDGERHILAKSTEKMAEHTISLPGYVKSRSLRRDFRVDLGLSDAIAISDEDMSYNLLLLSIDTSDKGRREGQLYLDGVDEDEVEPTNDIKWYYFDRPVEITGTDGNLICNIKALEGWNMVKHIHDDLGNTVKLQTVTSVPAEYRWRYHESF